MLLNILFFFISLHCRKLWKAHCLFFANWKTWFIKCFLLIVSSHPIKFFLFLDHSQTIQSGSMYSDSFFIKLFLFMYRQCIYKSSLENKTALCPKMLNWVKSVQSFWWSIQIVKSKIKANFLKFLFLWLYSQTCIRRPHFGPLKSDRLGQVVVLRKTFVIRPQTKSDHSLQVFRFYSNRECFMNNKDRLIEFEYTSIKKWFYAMWCL